MKLGKMLVLIIGLAAVAFAAKYALTGGAADSPNQATQPRRQLDSVRTRAKELERMQQQQADDITKKSDGD